MSKPLIAAAWLAALSLVVLAGLAAYTAFFDGENDSSWVEYQACLTSNGYVAQGDDSVNRQAKDVCGDF